MLADTVAEHAWQAHVAFNGSEALHLVEQFRPHIVLLDIAMLHMTGYDVAIEMHARFGSACPALIAHTAWADSDLVRMQATLAGFDAFVVKPAPLERLLDIIDAKHNQWVAP